MGVAAAIGLFASIVLHELAHSLAARRFGVEMRGITLFIFGGVAEMKDEPPSPLAECVIAIAGPIMSVLIAIVCGGLGLLGMSAGWPEAVYGVLLYLGSINAVLVVFNMVPAFPLDGGRVLRAVLWSIKDDLRWATRITSAIGSGFGMLLIFLGVVSFISGNFIGGIWWFLLGMFLNQAAQMSYQQLLVRRALEGETVSRFMQGEVQTVPPDTTLDDFVENYVYRHHFKMFPVAADGTLHGCMTTAKVKQYPKEDWHRHTVVQVAEPCSRDNTIESDADAITALKKMTQNGQSRLIVTDANGLKGVVALKDLMKFIALKLELEDAA
jgi:Zn-dependent protease